MRRSDLRTRSTWALLGAFGIVAAMFNYSFCLVRVQGRSMEPSFSHGQWLLIRRSNWPEFPLYRGDVVLVDFNGEAILKRVAGLPGDLPPVDDLRLLRFLRHQSGHQLSPYARELGRLFAPVPDGQLYVLGDNPRVSEDSRYFGPVPTAAVRGRVIQWNLPDAPEREQIGYSPRQGQTLASAPDRARF